MIHQKICVAGCMLLLTVGQAQTTDSLRTRRAGPAVAPVFGVSLPKGYRRWALVAPSHRPDLDEFRAILGNVKAMTAYGSKTLPFPDGTILAKIAWKHVPSEEYETAFVPGRTTTVQIMVKDSRRYASTGGWGFGRFTNGVPASAEEHDTCYACHKAFVKGHDLVFTRYAP